ncbi:MAG TPA: hypothetical protein VE442_16740 [Jatrophihabitans sp.]|nr:hypothetical protein [Jatrophihabitans sp.]
MKWSNAGAAADALAAGVRTTPAAAKITPIRAHHVPAVVDMITTS